MPFEVRDSSTIPGLPHCRRLPSSHAVLTTPVDQMGTCWLSKWCVPAPGCSPSARPSPLIRQVGVHIAAFEACSSFTRVTACHLSLPPKLYFVSRFQPNRFPCL